MKLTSSAGILKLIFILYFLEEIYCQPLLGGEDEIFENGNLTIRKVNQTR